jgi:acyl-CoA dehydrogenase
MTFMSRDLVKSVNEVIGPNAAKVDRECRFPLESISALRSLGMLGYFIPVDQGGQGGSIPEFCEIAALIGESCLSSAIIWTMHCQQVAVLVQYPISCRKGFLEDLATNQHLVASVTTEFGKGGDLLRTQSPIEMQTEGFILKRRAPIVSYAREAQYFLITMKGGKEDNSTSLFLVGREDGLVKEEGTWKSMGMRGTQSIPMSFDVKVPKERMISGKFTDVALQCMIPIGHLGWASSWFGAAKGLFNMVVRNLRRAGAQGTGKLDSELLRNRLGKIRMRLDLLEAIISTVASRFEEMRKEGKPASSYRDASFNILINNLKAAVSEYSFEVADRLMELAGLFDGYIEKETGGIERIFRDLRSATLMFKNDRLFDANGLLTLIERPALFTMPLERAEPNCLDTFEIEGVNRE